jgi:hypothetical protein
MYTFDLKLINYLHHPTPLFLDLFLLPLVKLFKRPARKYLSSVQRKKREERSVRGSKTICLASGEQTSKNTLVKIRIRATFSTTVSIETMFLQ